MTPSLLRLRSEIGHMKTDGRLASRALKGRLGDARHAVLFGCSHNLRIILARLRAFVAALLAAFYGMLGPKHGLIGDQNGLRPLAA